MAFFIWFFNVKSKKKSLMSLQTIDHSNDIWAQCPFLNSLMQKRWSLIGDIYPILKRRSFADVLQPHISSSTVFPLNFHCLSRQISLLIFFGRIIIRLEWCGAMNFVLKCELFTHCLAMSSLKHKRNPSLVNRK